MSLHDVRRLLIYIVLKASEAAFDGLFGDLEMAAKQMWSVAQSNRKVTLPVYHFCLSWPALEHPTDAQAIDAARKAIVALGAGAHQAVIGVHRDRDHVHVHVAIGRVNPETGRAFSTSHDYAKLEKVCREIEAEQGWSVDRGRFDAVTVDTPDGSRIALVPPSEAATAAKQAARKAGRGASDTDLGRERQTGVPSLADALSPSWKGRIRAVLDAAQTWAAVHAELEPLGLSYVRFGSGARIVLRGSDATLKPSQFGTPYGLPALRKRLGPWQDPEPETGPMPAPAPPATHPGVAADPVATRDPEDRPTGTPPLPTLVATLTTAPDKPDGARGLTSGETFKRTLLERTYTRITLDDDLVRAIRRVALDETPPRIALRSGAEIRDEGNRIGTTEGTDDDVQARIMVAMAVAKGWTRCRLMGSEAFQLSIARAATGTGLVLAGLSPEIEATLAKEAAGGPNVTGGLPRPGVIAAPPEMGAGQPDRAEDRPHDHANESPVGVPIPLPAPPDPHALRDAERARRRQNREVRRGASLERARSQAAKRQSLAGLLSNRRGPLEQAFRQALARHQATERAEARALSRATDPQDPGLPPVPLDAAARRVRAAETARLADDRTRPVAPVDHTDCRRHWQGSVLAPTSFGPLGITTATVARFPDQVRAGPHGGILCAHRDAGGSIVGFECFCDPPVTGWQEGIAPGGRAATCILGDEARAKTVYITATAATALAMAHHLDRADALFVSIADQIDEATIARLTTLTAKREVITSFLGNEVLEDAIHAALPWAETLQDVEAREAELDGTPDGDLGPEDGAEPKEEPDGWSLEF